MDILLKISKKSQPIAAACDYYESIIKNFVPKLHNFPLLFGSLERSTISSTRM